MSGGFFRGTSADQDTRFSNKAAKLLKSQKFPAELDQLVDMTKVKMDVIRPWIANRATEFLGFEDEVLINFIYGLLDGKEVDGKQIQIQLTGFMEKNTGKFMKELWGLLTSAQKNASGIPQQFLDAKAEETRKKKAETDRINYEVQKKKEQEEREAEQERQKKINADLETEKVAAAAAVSSKPSSGKSSLRPNPDDQVAGRRPPVCSEGKNGSISSLSRSRSQSYSVSRSPSRSPRRRYRSRSPSRSPRRRRRSTSIVRHARSPIYSPPRRRRSPLYARSPPRRRSPSLQRRRSPSPPRRRSPSPPRWRSPSPQRHRSPSPLRQRSPVPRSPRSRKWSPVRSPRRRPMDSQSPPRWRKRSRSPHYRNRRSLSRDRNTRLDVQDSRRYRDRCPQHRARGRSPNHSPFDRDEHEYERREHVRVGGRSVAEPPPHHRRSPMTSRSPDRNLNMRGAGGRTVPQSPRPHRSPPKLLHSSPNDPRTRENEERRLPSPYQIQMGPIRERGSHRESSELRKKQEHGHDMENVDRRDDPFKRRDVQAVHESERKEYGSRRVDRDRDSPINRSGENHSRPERSESRRKEYYTHGSLDPSERRDIRPPHASEAIEYGPGRLHHGPPSPDDMQINRPGANRLDVNFHSQNDHEDEEELPVLSKRSFSGDSYESNEQRHPAFKGPADYDKVYKPGTVHKPIQKLGPGKQKAGSESDIDENEAYRRKYAEKNKMKREETDEKIIEEDEDESASPRSSDERREAKRRRKEEKRIRKEERRRRREERHRRKEERRAGRPKAKAVATVTPPSAFERDYSAADESDDSHGGKDHSRKSYDEEMETEQQRLEIELRRKALESLRARKAISH